MRNRTGNQDVKAGTVLTARHIALSSDTGSLTVAGTLDASGPAGGVIDLAAGGDLVAEEGARLIATARQSGQSGGEVHLSSAAGRIVLDREGASIDTSGANAEAGGLGAGGVGVVGGGAAVVSPSRTSTTLS